MNCGFCGSIHHVQSIVLKNGYNVDRTIVVICCENCRNLLTEMATMLSLYFMVD